MPCRHEEIIKNLQAALESLVNAKIQAEREGRGPRCDHITLRPSYLPCPHPQCFGSGGAGSVRYVTTRRVDNNFGPPRIEFSDRRPEPRVEEEVWERKEIAFGWSDRAWAWRPVRVPRLQRSSEPTARDVRLLGREWPSDPYMGMGLAQDPNPDPYRAPLHLNPLGIDLASTLRGIPSPFLGSSSESPPVETSPSADAPSLDAPESNSMRNSEPLDYDEPT